MDQHRQRGIATPRHRDLNRRAAACKQGTALLVFLLAAVSAPVKAQSTVGYPPYSTAGPWVVLAPAPPVASAPYSNSADYIVWSGDYGDYRIRMSQLGGPVTTVDETATTGASLCLQTNGYSGYLVLAWSGVGNNYLNVMYSPDLGKTWVNKQTLYSEKSYSRPVLVGLGTSLLLGWTGTDGHINLLKSSDGFTWNTSQKVTLGETAVDSPALQVGRNSTLYLAWTGTDSSHHLNLLHSNDFGSSWGGKQTLAETSLAGPSLSNVNGGVVLGWAGTDYRVNVELISVAVGGYNFAEKRTYAEMSDHAPMVGYSTPDPVFFAGSLISQKELIPVYSYDITTLAYTTLGQVVETMTIAEF